MDKTKKIAIITGGTGGVGEAITKTLNNEGYFTIIIFNKNTQKAKLLEEELKNFEAYSCDLGLDADIEKTMREIIQKHKRIDVLVNAASPQTKNARFTQKNLQDFKEQMQINYFGAVALIKYAAEIMIAQKEGNIINILSQYTTATPPKGISDYIGAKYALLGITKSLAIELAQQNIRVNAISPGMIKTNFLSNLPSKAVEIVEQNTPLKLTTPQDIANATLFLVSDKANKISGINLLICGAISTQ